MFFTQGKSLSLICGAVKWLLDHEKQQQEEFEQLIEQQKADAERYINLLNMVFFWKKQNFPSRIQPEIMYVSSCIVGNE